MIKQRKKVARKAAMWAAVGAVLSATTLMCAPPSKAADASKQQKKPNQAPNHCRR